MQPKRYENLKIALLNVELELKAEKDNAEVRVSSVKVRKLIHITINKYRQISVIMCFSYSFIHLQEYQAIVDAEWNILYDKLEKIYKSGAKVVLSKLPIGDVATQYFADRDLFCAGRVQEEDLRRTMMVHPYNAKTSKCPYSLVLDKRSNNIVCYVSPRPVEAPFRLQ